MATATPTAPPARPATPTLEAVLTRARKGKVPTKALAAARRELAELTGEAELAFHPVQRRILETMRADRSRVWSPSALHDDFGDVPLANLSYHVRRLAAFGLLKLDRTRPRRGALEHFYRLAP